MSKLKGNWIAVLALVVAVITAIVVFLPRNPVSNRLGAIGGMLAENYIPYVMYNDGYYSARDVTTTGTLTGGTVVSSGVLTASGKIQADAGTNRSYTIATGTTATTQTLVQADILNYDTVLFTPNTGSVTLTFPASSTLTSLVPTAGDMAEQCWYNATGTAATNIVFAAGTGIDLQVATSTGSTGGAMDLTIAKGGMGCFKFLRQTDTDISAGLTEFEDAD